MNYILENALEMHNKHPETFDIPTLSEIQELKIGDYVKLIFKQDGHSERMWVEVTAINNQKYLGRLDNIPISVDMRHNDAVVFESKHIINTITIKKGEM